MTCPAPPDPPVPTEHVVPYFGQSPRSFLPLPTIKDAYKRFEILITFRPDAADGEPVSPTCPLCPPSCPLQHFPLPFPAFILPSLHAPLALLYLPFSVHLRASNLWVVSPPFWEDFGVLQDMSLTSGWGPSHLIPCHSSGLLLYNGQRKNSGADFISFGLVGGRPEFR